jgi:hypothetical protein
MLYGPLLPVSPPPVILALFEPPPREAGPRQADKREAEALRLLLREDIGGLMK